MAGNGLDEAFQRDIRLAATTNSDREVGWIGGLVWILGVLLLVTFRGSLGPFLLVVGALVTLAAGFAAAYLAGRVLARWGPEARRAEMQAEYRDNLERETQRRIAEMRARNSKR